MPPMDSNCPLSAIRFGPGPGGSTAVSTIAQLDGSFPNGKVQALRLLISGQIGRGGGFAFGTSCAVVSFNYLQMSALQLGRDASSGLPDRPGDDRQAAGRAGVCQRATKRTGLRQAGQLAIPSRAAGGQLTGQQFAFNRLAMRLGRRVAIRSMPRG